MLHQQWSKSAGRCRSNRELSRLKSNIQSLQNALGCYNSSRRRWFRTRPDDKYIYGLTKNRRVTVFRAAFQTVILNDNIYLKHCNSYQMLPLKRGN